MSEIELTKEEHDLLRWLGEEDVSQYGECHGPELTQLCLLGLAELMGEETEMNNSHIAKGHGIMFRSVRLTEAGSDFLRHERSRMR